MCFTATPQIVPIDDIKSDFRETLFQHTANKTNPLFQITKISSENIDIISVYRSGNSNQIEVQDSLLELVDEQKRTIICGDFNICFEKNRDSRLIKATEYFLC